MRILKITPSGHLTRAQIAYFGGGYSFWERLTLRGTGSGRLIWAGGLPHFDELTEIAENELSFVNFEIVKNGLILRLNRNGKTRAAGVRLSDIEAIEMEAFRIAVPKGRYQTGYRIVHRGTLRLTEKSGEQYDFQVVMRQFEDIVQFFERKELRRKFHYAVSTAAPEDSVDTQGLERILEILYS